MEFILYEPEFGEATMYGFGRQNQGSSPPEVVRESLELGRRWTHVLSGWFCDADYSTILCYNAANGEFAFHRARGDGTVELVREGSAWSGGWTHIVPAYLGKQALDGIVFYNSRTGSAKIYSTDSNSYIKKLYEYTWRRNWTHIIAGEFDRNSTGSLMELFFYDSSTGLAQLYGINRKGHIHKVQERSLNVGWSHVVHGRFGRGSGDDLFFYDARAGIGEFWETDSSTGQLSRISQHDDLRTGWTHVAPIRDDQAQRMLFYDAQDGACSVPVIAGRGRIEDANNVADLPVNRNVIVTGKFYDPSPARATDRPKGSRA